MAGAHRAVKPALHATHKSVEASEIIAIRDNGLSELGI